MASLQKWENIIKEKRKDTPFRDFLKEIVSWKPLVFHKNNWLISVYPESERIKKICTFDEFEKNREELTKKWIDYDFNKTFLENFKKLLDDSYFASLWIYMPCENAQYSDNVGWVKNTYLSSVVSSWSENVLYSFVVRKQSTNILNSTMVTDSSQNIYMGFCITASSNVFYSKFINNSYNIWFCSNLNWCSECILSANLDNKKYCIKNKEYSKEEYFIKKQEILDNKKDFLKIYGIINDNWHNMWSTNVTWSYLVNCENVQNGCFSTGIKNGRNVMFVGWGEWIENAKDFVAGLVCNDVYASCGAWLGSNIYCSFNNSWSNIYYSYFCNNCSFCFWCIGLKNKQFCIFNKQYTKEEWYELADKIFAQMDAEWILGDFFPGKLNPFYFNDTAAYLIDDTFTKDEVTKDWYMWRDEEIKVDIPEWSEIVNVEDLDIVNYDESILKKVIKDKNWNYYRIVKMEYDFLKKHNLPLPEIHWLDRIKMGFKM